MPLFDLPLDALRTYEAPCTEPQDFDAFWHKTLSETAAFPLDVRLEKLEDTIYELVDVFDVTFNGYGGHPIKGWFLFPKSADQPLPCVVTFRGYSSGRSFPTDHLAPVVAGCAHFVMDTRGQGFSTPGETPDPVGSGSHSPGFVTFGIESADTYYYRRVYTDAVRAVEAAASNDRVDPGRLCVSGISQGGGIAIAAAALSPGRVKLLVADVPFLCHFRRAVEITDFLPYREITDYLKCRRDRVEQVFRTLSYFDGIHFAPWVEARSLFSVGLMDMTCPPSTVFGAYNRIRAEKEIKVYEFNEHEGGEQFQDLERLKFFTACL